MSEDTNVASVFITEVVWTVAVVIAASVIIYGGKKLGRQIRKLRPAK